MFVLVIVAGFSPHSRRFAKTQRTRAKARDYIEARAIRAHVL